ncbi:hypothetical protein BC941DRAFT_457245 [Chlamydoabsidia padenii]|nr:hypothetical protein BC941DRAFT_457245 [Chlamydoabsidia padenii]
MQTSQYYYANLAEGSSLVVNGNMTIKRYRNDKGVWAMSLSISVMKIVKGIDWRVNIVNPHGDEGELVPITTDEVVRRMRRSGVLRAEENRHRVQARLSEIFSGLGWSADDVVPMAQVLSAAFPNLENELIAVPLVQFQEVLVRGGFGPPSWSASAVRSLLEADELISCRKFFSVKSVETAGKNYFVFDDFHYGGNNSSYVTTFGT